MRAFALLHSSRYFPIQVICNNQNQARENMAENKPSPAEAVRATVPKLIDLTEKVLFGDVWERPELSKRDRSLITCAALVAMQRPDQLRFHLGRALQNGVTQAELSELITHLAFYSGWPTAMTAATVAKEVFEKRS
jgi:4-carboxymuconolactone decarboxylase